ncbi:hypothetical protein GCM10028806_16270 [Spirosoma terrae]|uniref:T9SS type A sorting domain-containing protein n=1 Tax=Spirosoma terrae TaxID=1968276 RepID=A0A6L9L3R6_9BACT|nr:T9SS type A sorting domain-containing protein [Spirosoma terrae]NDU95275.1 T9SS type A sorting domain-containing protein [Spirosoma terrae]
MPLSPLSSSLWLAILTCQFTLAQTVISNASHSAGTSDNTGTSLQSGTEVLHSSLKAGVQFEVNGSYEHVGQFYVAEDGLWNQSSQLGSQIKGTDYFGYAPSPFGSGLVYQGKGIMGASATNGGQGAGRPAFGRIELNSTGEFPLAAGMYIAGTIAFNQHGPGRSSIITTPNCTQSASPEHAVVFAPTASVLGANKQNYIDGFASVASISSPFLLPVGDATAGLDGYHPLLINSSQEGTITARYLYSTPYLNDTRSEAIEWISPTGSWLLSGPTGTNLTVYAPEITKQNTETAELQLVGYNGRQWVPLADPVYWSTDGTTQFSASLIEGVSVIGIGLVKTEKESIGLTLWPNPTKASLQVSVSSRQPIDQLQVFDLKGNPLLHPVTATPMVNTSSLLPGTYVLEVQTQDGQRLRRRFLKQ